MTNKGSKESTPAQMEGALKKIMWSALVVAVLFLTAGKIDMSKNPPA